MESQNCVFLPQKLVPLSDACGFTLAACFHFSAKMHSISPVNSPTINCGYECHFGSQLYMEASRRLFKLIRRGAFHRNSTNYHTLHFYTSKVFESRFSVCNIIATCSKY